MCKRKKIRIIYFTISILQNFDCSSYVVVHIHLNWKRLVSFIPIIIIRIIVKLIYEKKAEIIIISRVFVMLEQSWSFMYNEISLASSKRSRTRCFQFRFVRAIHSMTVGGISFSLLGFQKAFRISVKWSLESPRKYLTMERSFHAYSTSIITNNSLTK